MRVIPMVMTIGLVVLPAARAARADGWWEGCHNDDQYGDDGGCNCDGDTSTDDGVSCRASGDAASVGSSLALVAVVAYGLGRRRKK
jgi:MYXO-CTERM domain-containing protein